MDLVGLHHIAIEGPIGVGKTTLARRLAAHLQGRLLLEAPEANPHLERFYADAGAHALQTQLAFLHHRADQVRVLRRSDPSGPTWVSDFLFDKDALFAALTLSPHEHAVYRAHHAPLAEALARELSPPDLVIWLRAPVPVLQARIRRRGIPMEQGIADDYLARLGAAYADHFAGFHAAPVLAVDHARFDPAADAADFERLLAALASVPRGHRGLVDAGLGAAGPAHT